ncbi:MAG: winged helix-turn-helix domain-containing protein [Roseibium sp.]|nr:winged helix-turn-helix domain-containing protein [Roseibium sp.]
MVCGRIKDLVVWLREDYGVSVCETTVSGALKDMGFVKLTARPHHHGQNEPALEVFKEASARNSKPSEPAWGRKHH